MLSLIPVGGNPEVENFGIRQPATRVAEGVIMKIGGWKTRSVFDRYAIVSQSDIRDAMAKLEARQHRDNADAAQEQKSTEEQVGQSLGRATSTKPDLGISHARTTSKVN
ncbi:MAG: hypothetical protein P4M04_02995 [Acidobacteriota bacterium]|nr:hypothetical protein [Acidobacteriota bacterium]